MENTSIIICGQKFDINSRVVLWDEKLGLNGYNTSTIITKEQDRKTGKEVVKKISGKRYGNRNFIGNITLEKLQKIITQFFLHHSGLYTSKTTFDVLHNQRGLSVHFILDDDGTIYQTLDIKEKAYHGGNNNPMSIGIEIDSRADANKYPDAYDEAHQLKYKVGPRNKKNDIINGMKILGYEYNNQQYQSLIKLGIVLKEVFPLLSIDGICDFPRTTYGVFKKVIPNPERHRGFICHYNNNKQKIDPVCFDHERFILGVKNKNPDQKKVFFKYLSWKERQIILTKLGYDLGKIDGIYGPKTKKVIEECQKKNGFKVTGDWTDEMDNFCIKGIF